MHELKGKQHALQPGRTRRKRVDLSLEEAAGDEGESASGRLGALLQADSLNRGKVRSGYVVLSYVKLCDVSKYEFVKATGSFYFFTSTISTTPS